MKLMMMEGDLSRQDGIFEGESGMVWIGIPVMNDLL